MLRKALLLTCLFSAVPAMAAGPLSFGVIGGWPLVNLVDAKAPYTSIFNKWAVGGVIDLDLPFGLGTELDLMREGNSGYSIGSLTTSAGAWQFPLLLKYKFGKGPVRPYVGAGIAFRHLSELKQLGDPTLLFTQSQGSRGFVFEGGVRFNLKLIKLAPELRYTHWDNSPITLGSLASQVVNYRQNQVEALIGLTF